MALQPLRGGGGFRRRQEQQQPNFGPSVNFGGNSGNDTAILLALLQFLQNQNQNTQLGDFRSLQLEGQQAQAKFASEAEQGRIGARREAASATASFRKQQLGFQDTQATLLRDLEQQRVDQAEEGVQSALRSERIGLIGTLKEQETVKLQRRVTKTTRTEQDRATTKRREFEDTLREGNETSLPDFQGFQIRNRKFQELSKIEQSRTLPAFLKDLSSVPSLSDLKSPKGIAKAKAYLNRVGTALGPSLAGQGFQSAFKDIISFIDDDVISRQRHIEDRAKIVSRLGTEQLEEASEIFAKNESRLSNLENTFTDVSPSVRSELKALSFPSSLPERETLTPPAEIFDGSGLENIISLNAPAPLSTSVPRTLINLEEDFEMALRGRAPKRLTLNNFGVPEGSFVRHPLKQGQPSPPPTTEQGVTTPPIPQQDILQQDAARLANSPGALDAGGRDNVRLLQKIFQQQNPGSGTRVNSTFQRPVAGNFQPLVDLLVSKQQEQQQLQGLAAGAIAPFIDQVVKDGTSTEFNTKSRSQIPIKMVENPDEQALLNLLGPNINSLQPRGF